MKHSEGLEWAIHSCTVLANMPPDFPLPTRLLAAFFDLPEPYLAKQMQKLSARGLVVTKRGAKGGYTLAKPPEDITMLQIVDAIDGPERHFRCTEIRRCGPSGVDDKFYPKPCGIARTMWRAEAAWRLELSQTTLADVLALGAAETPDEQLGKAMMWFQSKMKEG